MGIDLEDEDLAKLSKSKFKKLLKQKIHDGALKYLKSIQDKHTKMSNLNYQELKCSKYLLDNRLSNEDKKLLFKFRTRMYTVKANFRTQFQDKLDCKLCKSSIESQAKSNMSIFLETLAK